MDKGRVWLTVLENLKLSLSSANFATWFSRTFIINFKKINPQRQIVEIGCPSSFISNTIENRYYGLIKNALDQTTKKKNDLVFIVKENPFLKEKISSLEKGTLFEVSKKETEDEEIQEAFKKVGLRPDFNFETFAVSSSNQMAHAAAMAVAQSLSKAYNPLFLYGGVGVGKTHLIQAIANTVLKKTVGPKLFTAWGKNLLMKLSMLSAKKLLRNLKKDIAQLVY